jgi:hypothetical protein
LNKHLTTLMTVVITFFLTWALNTMVSYYSSDKGGIWISKPIVLDGKSFSLITIENYSKEFLDGIALEVPQDVLLGSIFSDTAVDINDSKPSLKNPMRLVIFNQVSPSHVTRIYMPRSNINPLQIIRVVNTEAGGITIKHDDELESPLRKSLISGLTVACIYAFIYVVFSFYLKSYLKKIAEENDKKIDALEISAQKLREDSVININELKEELNALRADAKVISTRLAKQRLLLQARLFDYSKELEFWRNAVKSLLFSKGENHKTAEDIIRVVRHTLGTHGTQDTAGSFEEIRVAADFLAASERQAELNTVK